MDTRISNLIYEIIFYSVINSFVTFGIIQTIKCILDKDKLNRFVGINATYIMGMIMGFLLSDISVLWQKIIYGFFIGCTSIAVYKSAIQSLLGIIPGLVGKFFGVAVYPTQTCIEPAEEMFDVPEGPKS